MIRQEFEPYEEKVFTTSDTMLPAPEPVVVQSPVVVEPIQPEPIDSVSTDTPPIEEQQPPPIQVAPTTEIIPLDELNSDFQVIRTVQTAYDPRAADLVKSGETLCNIGQYRAYMSGELGQQFVVEPESRRCLEGIFRGFYSGMANDDGSLTIDGVRFYWKDLTDFARN
jgi:hypothetical protein